VWARAISPTCVLCSLFVFMQRLRSWKCESLVRLASALRLSVLVGFAVCAASLWAQPANDNFANAILLEGDFGSVTGSNSDATSESGEPSHAGLPPGPSIWYKWTASSDLPVEFDTFNSTCDPVLAVYTGTS
jgi:hypothetical protein